MSYSTLLAIGFFIIGTVFGSFYNVVGYRLPKKMSLMWPPSHCPNCDHLLTPIELIPVFSYIFLGGKCRWCKKKIAWFYPVFEFTSGMLFMLSFLVYGLTLECLLSIVFVSMLLIVIISDYLTMTISDSVLIVFTFFILVIKYFMHGLQGVGLDILSGAGAFLFMYAIKLLGDFIFKKESMGGGDIKLLATLGIMYGVPMSIVTVFMGAIIGLPISLITIKRNSSHEIPFGPYLAISAMLIVLLKINTNTVIDLLTIY